MNINYVGLCSGCPVCGTAVVSDGDCECGAKVRLLNLTEEAQNVGETIGLYEAELVACLAAAIPNVVEMMVEVCEEPAVDEPVIKLGLLDRDGVFYIIAAQRTDKGTE